METGDSAPPVGPAAQSAVGPGRRWQGTLLILLLFLLVLGLGGLLLSRQPAPAQTGLLRITPSSARLAKAGVPHWSPFRKETCTVENRGAGALVLWEPCRIERKATGRIMVAGTTRRTLPLPGTNGAGPCLQFLQVELTGTNRGPWRLLVPVARYEWIARLEKLLGKRPGSLVRQVHLLDSWLQHSRTWVASEWFEEASRTPDGPGGPTFPRFPGSSPGAFPGARRPEPPMGLADQDASETLFFLLRHFYSRYRRWPTSLAEVKNFAADTANLQPEFPVVFEGEGYTNAVFSTNAAGGLDIKYGHGGMNGRMSLGGPPDQGPPTAAAFPLPGLPPQNPGQSPGAFPRARTPGLPMAPSMQANQNPSRTLTFLLRNFNSRYRRWPTNLTEVKSFATDKANLQPEFPAVFEGEEYTNAVFSTNTAGGLEIKHRHGTMSLNGPSRQGPQTAAPPQDASP